MTADSIRSGLRRLEQHDVAADADRFAALLAELERWNRKTNLTAKRQSTERVTAHPLDSLAVRGLRHGFPLSVFQMRQAEHWRSLMKSLAARL